MFSSFKATPQRPRYRSPRSVRSTSNSAAVHTGLGPIKWTRSKTIFFVVAVLLLAAFTVVPIILLEGGGTFSTTAIEAEISGMIHQRPHPHQGPGNLFVPPHELHAKSAADQHRQNLDLLQHHNGNGAEQPNMFDPMLEDEEPVSPLVRGVNTLPMSKTPALVGASRGHIQCDVPVDEEKLVFWNHPQGDRDRAFVSPFAPTDANTKTYYFTFQPDPGGWNNIRMSLETLFVMASAMGRTLVLPPKHPLYLLGMGAEHARSFGDFFPLEQLAESHGTPVITMKEFLQREMPHWDGVDAAKQQELLKIAEMCLFRPPSDTDISCRVLNTELKKRGFQPQLKAMRNCMIFDEDVLNGKELASDALHMQVDRFCGAGRKPVFFDKELQQVPWIHWDASCEDAGDGGCFRLLQHFYTFIHFTDPGIENYYKRFVRDFLHYKDDVYCAAWKVIRAIEEEAKQLGVAWSSWHVRRGDLQYKKVKIPASEWYENTKEVWQPGELIYMATDERNKTFFDPVRAKKHPVRFLDDYWEVANLKALDSSYLGMVDTIIASHGRAFAGTWFSTFTGYINRMRGYLGKSMKDSWYSFLDRKEVMREYLYPEGNYPAREWPIGWLCIDSDELIEEEQDPYQQHLPKPKGVVIEVDPPIISKKDVPHPAVAAPAGDQSLADVKPVKDEKRPDIKVSELVPDEGYQERPVARLLAGRPLDQTPAVKDAKRAHIDCEVNVDSLAYWNDPQGLRDQNFKSPFAVQDDDTRYITFSPDRGGWNNIRMSMEIIFVIAAATGRTLVLPPKEPLYLLKADAKNRHRGFADFFPLQTADFQKRVKTISMEEFVKLEGNPDGRVPIPAENRKAVEGAAEHCDRRAQSGSYCNALYEYLAEVAYVPQIKSKDGCLVFDVDVYEGKDLTFENKEKVKKRCGERKITYWNAEMIDPVVVHFRGSEKDFRLLAHFYGMIFFTDPAVDHYFKRFVRDFLHYHDSINCAAGKIVKALQIEGAQRGFPPDEEGAGGYSAMHIRRGDLQYKKVKIPADEWYENTKEVWSKNELLYIATDERNKTWFDPIRQHHTLRFLDDYWDFAGLGDLDPNYMGMLDTIIASRGRAFAGTWFSTFSGYITRLRGYHGMSMMDTWYSFLPKKTAVHEWIEVDHMAYAFEWPDGWIGIDADVWPTRDIF